MVFVNPWYILWSQIKFYVTLALLLKRKYEADVELKRNNHSGKSTAGMLQVVVALTVQLNRLRKSSMADKENSFICRFI